MTRADPESRLKADTGAWLQRVKASGLILPDQKPLKRSPVECGISIDYLAQLAESIKEHPLLPTTTRLVVENLINAATSEQGCRFIDLIPQEHVGPATAVVCHCECAQLERHTHEGSHAETHARQHILP